MKFKRIKSAVLVISVLTSAMAFAGPATKNDSSDFILKLFNSTKVNQPLHYTIVRKGQNPVEGDMVAGADSGLVPVEDVESTGQSHAEIIVKDGSGATIWDNTVTFWGAHPDFYTNTIALDSRYNVSTHAYPSTHMIGFDIKSTA